MRLFSKLFLILFLSTCFILPVNSSSTSVWCRTVGSALNVTGDNTPYHIPFQSLVDKGNHYNNSTSLYKVPSTGLYYFNLTVVLSGVTSLDTTAYLEIFSDGFYQEGIFSCVPSKNGTVTLSISGLRNFLKNWEIDCIVQVDGSTKTIGVEGLAIGLFDQTNFSIFKVK